MLKRPRRVLLFLGAAAGAVVLLLLSFGRAPLAPPLPNPNGYDDLLKAGQMATGEFGSLADRDHEELRSLVTANAAALRLLRMGLTRDCAVPTEATIANFRNVSGDLIRLKSLAKVLAAEGRLAEMENRPVDAARSYIDCIRLGAKMSRGGLMINRLVGIACEGVGGIPLVKVVPKLPCERIHPLVSELEQVDGGTVPWSEILINENSFVRAEMGKLPDPIKLLSDLWQARSVRSASKERHDLAAAHVRLLATELALRCYRCDHGIAPMKLQDLVPQYLQRVPVDPFSDYPFVYRQNRSNWVLYSLGPDRVDDGGKTVNRSDYGIAFGFSASGKGHNKGDVLYDSPW